jgi:hypothetical protein
MARGDVEAMPRYVFTTRPITRSAFERAITLAARRFPELAIDHRSSGDVGVDARDTWVCDAPHETHLVRWVAAAGIDATAIALDDSAHALASVVASLTSHGPGHHPAVDHQQRKEVQQ